MSIQRLSWRQGADVVWEGESSYGNRLAQITVDGEEYLVGNTDDCENAAKISAREYFDEGTFNQSFVLRFINDDQFATDIVNDDEYFDEEVERNPERYIRDDPEGPDDTYTEEQIDKAVSRLKEARIREIADNPFEYLHEMGYNDHDAYRQLEPYINRDNLVEAAVNEEGTGHFLNAYDGSEYSSTDLEVLPDMLPEDLKDFLGQEAVEKDDLCYYKV